LCVYRKGKDIANFHFTIEIQELVDKNRSQSVLRWCPFELLSYSFLYVQELCLRPNSESGYALYSDNPVAKTEHCLQGDLKVSRLFSVFVSSHFNFLLHTP